MNCQNCGSANSDVNVYCERCGAILFKPVRIDESLIREPRLALMKAVNLRAETDYVMPIALVFLPLIVGVATSVLGILVSFMGSIDQYVDLREYYVQTLPWLTLVIGGSILSELLYAYVVYKLVKRANEHYSREREVRFSMISIIRAAANTPERQRLVDGNLMMMSTASGTAERHREPWFWAFVTLMPSLIMPMFVLPLLFVNPEEPSFLVIGLILLGTVTVALASLILQLYMLNFLGKTMQDHDSRWNTFSSSARAALSKLGFPAGKPFKISLLPKRDFGMFLVLTILTGIFFYYWIYTLAKDPNEHFKIQWATEDNFLSSITPNR
jgi:hypothetical protein